jgi:D-alanyl-D-alanine carboxypeptidase
LARGVPVAAAPLPGRRRVWCAATLDAVAERDGRARLPGSGRRGTEGRLEATLRNCLAAFLRRTPDAPGAVVAVVGAGGGVDAGELVRVAAGLADRRTGAPMAPGHSFRYASSTKTFTAAAALRLAELGRLHVDDTLPRFFGNGLVRRLHVLDGVSSGARITVRHLLQHTSGVRSPDEEHYLALIRADPQRRWTALDQVDLGLAAGPPTGPPGGTPRYSDVGYVLLALLIERAADRPLASALRWLLRPAELGLRTLHLETLEPMPPHCGPRMPQYLGDEDTTGWDPSFDLYGGGGLVGDAADLALFWDALFGGRVFSDAGTLRLMLAAVPEASMDSAAGGAGDSASGRAVGLGVLRRRFGALDAWHHSGFWGSFALHQPDHGVTIAGAVNQAPSRLPAGALRVLREELLAAACA